MTNQFIKSIDLKRDLIGSFDEYPFCLPAIKNLDSLELHPKATYIIGENGTGKSTILESTATAFGFNPRAGQKTSFSPPQTPIPVFTSI
jgi:predicted ATPase